MVRFQQRKHALVGQAGSLVVPVEDEITRKQRYFQLRELFAARGAAALLSRKRGPQRNYRRTDELVRQVIRHRFLDPDATVEVIAQKLRQSGLPIGTRSVERVIAEFGLQKKTL